MLVSLDMLDQSSGGDTSYQLYAHISVSTIFNLADLLTLVR